MINLLAEGNYRLIETKGQTKILTLDDSTTLAWVAAGEIGEILITSLHPHHTDHVLAMGPYKLYEVKNEPELTDLQHLELSVGNDTWQGYLLPNGLPDKEHIRHRIIPANEIITGKFV